MLHTGGRDVTQHVCMHVCDMRLAHILDELCYDTAK